MVAFTHGKSASFYLDDRNVTGSAGGGLSDCWFKEITIEHEIDTAETSCIGAGDAKTYMPGMADATLEMEGMFDRHAVDASSLDYKLHSMHAVNDLSATYLPAGDSTTLSGIPCYMFRGMLSNHTIETTTDDVASIELEFQSNIGVQRGIVLHGLQARTTLGNGTQVHDNLASPGATTTGWSAVLHVTGITGTSTPGVTATIEDSADNSTYLPLTGGAFGAKTAVGGYYIAGAATATVRRYVRVAWTIQGSTPSVNFFVAFNRGL